MREDRTLMYAEAELAADCIRRQASEAKDAIEATGHALRALRPGFLATIARGSSDHAATYGKYAIETATGVPVTSHAPSISSIYHANSTMRGAACIAISQSGRSPDLIAALKRARSGGALAIAVVNDVASPLAGHADHVLPLCAYPETAVAATKSYLASLAITARIVAAWAQDRSLADALEHLPDAMSQSWDMDWSDAEAAIVPARSLYVIGRGMGLGVAQEAALKFKETCRIHAEAYSAAEVLHGPAAVVREGFPVLAFVQEDESAASVRETCVRLADMGARVFVAGARVTGCTSLPTLPFDARLQPILHAQSFYRLVNRCALALGENPDQPPHLMKVTKTT